MKEITIVMLGHSLSLHYAMHEGNYVEWYLAPSPSNENENDIHAILDTILRLNHSQFIESKIREVVFYQAYAEASGSPWPADDIDPTCPF